MGGSLLRAVVESGVFDPSMVYAADSNRERLESLCDLKIRETDNRELSEKSDAVVLAVKPADMPSLAGEIRDFLKKNKVLISIAAGISTVRIESLFGQVPVIRVMPNLNVRVKAGLLPYCLGKHASGYNGLVEKLFSFSGFVFELDEDKFDAVTAISGSGPGFIFFIAEIIESICRARNFTAEEADLITAHLIYGSGKMLVDTKMAPAALKKMVSSPGGTTMAGLNVFMDRGLKEIFEKAIESAEKRSRELSGRP